MEVLSDSLTMDQAAFKIPLTGPSQVRDGFLADSEPLLAPGCCNTTEAQYNPIDGKALLTVNGLQKCKFFIFSLPKLTLCLEMIEKLRLINFKKKFLLNSFKTVRVQGKKNNILES